MNKQIIICVECDRKSQTDFYYIHKVINTAYYLTAQVRVTPVFLGGKFNYNKARVIAQHKKKFAGESVVVYCFDFDDPTFNINDVNFKNAVTSYCLNNHHELVWFVRDIEEVMTGESCSKSKKKAKAISFAKNDLAIFDFSALRIPTPTRPGTSNLLSVLDKFLTQSQSL